MKLVSFKMAIGAILLFLVAPTFAQTAVAQPDAIQLLQTAIGTSLDKIFTDLQAITIKWLGLFIFLQFTWTNFHLLTNGADLEKIWAKLLGSLFWFGMCFYIFNNGPPFIKNMGTYIMATATHTTGAVFDTMQPVNLGLDVASTLLTTLNGSQSILGSLNPFPSIMMGLVSLVILAVSGLVAFKIFMIFIETKMVIALSPLSFSLLGLNAFKDQGLAPLKYIVSMALRMFLYGAVISAMLVFSSTITAAFKALPAASDPSVWPPIWAAAIGYGLLGALTLRVDSIAVMLASGTSQMSTGDSAAVGAIAGAAAGLAVQAATGGSAAAGAAAQVPGSMGAFMRSLPGGAASVSNASSSGTGATMMETPKAGPSLSKSNNTPNSGGGGQGPLSGPASNSSPRQTDNATATAQTASNAATGVMAAGGSQAASNAAATAAMAGGSNEQVAAAVVSAGGTAAQGAAAATGMAIGEAGGSQDAIRSGAAAVGAGKNPATVGDIVGHTLVPGTARGESSEVSAAAKKASTTKPAEVPTSDSGSSAAIGGAAGAAPTLNDVLKMIEQSKPGAQAKDPTKDLKDHIFAQAPAMQIHMNTHQD